MSDFFDSQIIQDELEEINKIQEKLYGSVLTFGVMSREDKLEHIEMLQNLLENSKLCIRDYHSLMIQKQLK